MEIMIQFLYQMLFTVGVVVAFGLLIALCRRVFCLIIGEAGPKILLITGVVGTPIHELSHALMCLIFGHRIDEIRLYQPHSNDGTLGYVSHSFNPRNIYHQIGNFFIGIAPIIGGSGVLILLMYLLVPDMHADVWGGLNCLHLIPRDFLDGATYVSYLKVFRDVLLDIFNTAYLDDVRWWIFIVLAFLISSHMELSGADIKGSIKGLLVIAGILLLVDTVLFFIPGSILDSMTSAMASFVLPIISFLAISGIFSVAMVIIALVVKAIQKVIEKAVNH